MQTIFKVFIEFVTILLLFYVVGFFFFSPKACGISALWPGIEPGTPALESEVLTTGPPGTSQDPAINIIKTFLSKMANSWTAINLEAVQSNPADLTTFRKLFPSLSQNPRVLAPSFALILSYEVIQDKFSPSPSGQLFNPLAIWRLW